MDDYSLLVEMLTDVLGKPKRHSHTKGQISFDCPVCSYEIKGLDSGDRKGNFEVNYTKNAYKCWSCYDSHETHGNLFMLFKKWGKKNHLKKLELILPEEFVPAEKKYRKIRLPTEYIFFGDVPEFLKPTHYFKQAENYIKYRFITDDQIERYKIGFCYEGFYAGRIIIPSFDNKNELNYFIARSYDGQIPKYNNPEVEKEKMIFNECLVDWEKDIYLVEGAFDHIFVPNSIPLLGKHLSEMLWQRLYNEAKGYIYILLDGDAWLDAQKLYLKLNGGKLHKRIRVIKLPKDKDIADLKGFFKEEWILELERE